MMAALKAAFVGCFLAILALPAIQLAFHPFTYAPLQEHRAQPVFRPHDSLTHLWDGGGKAGIDFEKWFNAVYPMRDLYVRVVNQITYSVFHESNQVLLDKNGCTMDRFTVLDNQRTEDSLTDAQLDEIAVKVVAARDYFAQRGQTLILLPIPLKNTFDKTIAFREIRRPEVTGYDRFVALINRLHVPAVDVVGALAKGKRYGKEFPFFRTDLHWNYTGAYYAAEAMVNAVNEREGKPSISFDGRFVTAGDVMGGDSLALGLLWPAKEAYWTPAVIHCSQEHKGKLANGKDAWYYASDGSCKRTLLPAIAVVGNSFMMYFQPTGLFDYFEKTYLVHDLSHFSELSSYVPSEAKYIFWQFFETEIPFQLRSASWWAWLDAAKQQPNSRVGTAHAP